MRYRTLGQSGLHVSELGLGCNNLGGRIDAARSRSVVHGALDLGVTLFDVADVYGRRDAHAGASEEALGAALVGHRDKIVLATKFGMKMVSDDDPEGRHSGASRQYIVQAVEASLRRLRTDRIDLYQLHVPDPRTPIEEILRALDDLTRAGKIRFAGLSNFPAWQVADAWHVAKENKLSGFVSCQDELSLLSRDALRELVPALSHFRLGLLPYFPLASGMLTGKYREGAAPPDNSRMSAWTYLAPAYQTDGNWSLIDRLRLVADRHDRTLTELALGWLLAQPVVSSVIAGATSVEQVRANAQACARPLTEAELAAVNQAVGTAAP